MFAQSHTQTIRKERSYWWRYLVRERLKPELLQAIAVYMARFGDHPRFVAVNTNEVEMHRILMGIGVQASTHECIPVGQVWMYVETGFWEDL